MKRCPLLRENKDMAIVKVRKDGMLLTENRDMVNAEGM